LKGIEMKLQASDFNWREMMEVLSSLTEEEVLVFLNSEVKGGKRWSVIERLHQRYTMLRAARERSELLKKVSK